MIAADLASHLWILHRFAGTWKQYAHHKESPSQEMDGWIRTHTPPEAIFIAPPWMADFSLDAERAGVVDFKRNPHNALIMEWYRRYCAVNGGPFRSVGFGTFKELSANFSRLSPSQLDQINKLYGAEYYLALQRRDDLHAQLIHQNGSYYLYKLE